MATHYESIHESKHAAAEAALSRPGKPIFALIQHGARFAVYTSAAALDADADAYRGQVHVREIVLKERPRRPFVDLDGPADVDQVAQDLIREFGGSKVLRLRTTRGFHLITQDAPLVSFAEHARGLVALKCVHPAVDAGVLHSLRVPGTRKPGGVPKEFPQGYNLSELLAQPFDAPAADEAGPGVLDLFEGEPETDADEFAAAASLALSGSRSALKLRPTPAGPGVLLDRVETSPCRLCDCSHERENAYALRLSSDTGAAYCYRFGRGRFVTFACADVDKNGPGRRNPVHAEEYEAAPLHAGGPGCRAPPGDYIDGSPCGVGKSKAAWDTIDPNESVLCVSYRRSFTAKTASDYGLATLPPTGKLAFGRGTGKRAVVQLESLHRVDVEAGGLDVLLVDEWHGVMRHGYGELATAKSRTATERLQSLITEAGRVIVLDAYANDVDRGMFERLRGSPFAFVRNTYRPDIGREVVRHPSHNDLLKELRHWIATRQPDEKCAVFSHLRDKGPTSVEAIARILSRAGLRVKYYHAGTDQKQRAQDFSDVARAYANVDVVVYNASLEAGVSIELPEFTRMFCFSSRMGAVEVVAQALKRFRCIDRIDYAGATARPVSFAPQTAAGVMAAYQRSIRGRAALDLLQVNLTNAPGTAAEALDSFAGRAWVEVVLEGFRSARHFDERLFDMLRGSGYTIRACTDPVAPVHIREDAPLDAFLTKTTAERTADAAVLDPDELHTLSNSTAPKSSDQLAAIDRAMFARTYECHPDDVTAELVQRFAGREGAWIRYRAALKGQDPPEASGPRARASTSEVTRRISDLTDALGFGRVDAIASVDLKPVRGCDFEAVVTANAKLFTDLHASWGYLFGSDICKPAMKTVTVRSARGALHSVLGWAYGIRIESDNARPARGTYRLMPTAWPCLGTDDLAEHRRAYAPDPLDFPADVVAPAAEAKPVEAEQIAQTPQDNPDDLDVEAYLMGLIE